MCAVGPEHPLSNVIVALLHFFQVCFIALIWCVPYVYFLLFTQDYYISFTIKKLFKRSMCVLVSYFSPVDETGKSQVLRKQVTPHMIVVMHASTCLLCNRCPAVWRLRPRPGPPTAPPPGSPQSTAAGSAALNPEACRRCGVMWQVSLIYHIKIESSGWFSSQCQRECQSWI